MTNSNKTIGSPLRKGNKAQVAEFFDVTLPTVEAWVRKGAPVISRGGRGVSWEFDLRAIAEWLYAGKTEEGATDPDTMDPQDRKAWYESEHKRRDLQVKDGELCESVEVERVVATAFAAIRQSVLGIPDRLERETGIAPEIAEAVERQLHAELQVLADSIAALAPVDASL